MLVSVLKGKLINCNYVLKSNIPENTEHLQPFGNLSLGWRSLKEIEIAFVYPVFIACLVLLLLNWYLKFSCLLLVLVRFLRWYKYWFTLTDNKISLSNICENTHLKILFCKFLMHCVRLRNVLYVLSEAGMLKQWKH